MSDITTDTTPEPVVQDPVQENNFDSLSSEEKESLLTDYQNNNSWKTKNQERSTELKKGEASLKEKTEAFEAREKLFNKSNEMRLREAAQTKKIQKPIGESVFMKMRREQEQARQINKAIYTNKLGNWKLALSQGKERHPDMNIEKIERLEKIARTMGQDNYIDILYYAEKGLDIEKVAEENTRRINEVIQEGYKKGRESFRADALAGEIEDEEDKRSPSEKRVDKIVKEMRKKK